MVQTATDFPVSRRVQDRSSNERTQPFCATVLLAVTRDSTINYAKAARRKEFTDRAGTGGPVSLSRLLRKRIDTWNAVRSIHNHTPGDIVK